MSDEQGYYNAFGGFHRMRDREAVTRLLRLLCTHHPATWRYIAHLLAERWRHRRCDTTDFHHELGCPAQPFFALDNRCYVMWQRLGTRERYSRGSA